VAQQIQTLLIDDLDGTPAEGTVRFGLDGTDFEIDLNAGHDKALRDVLAPYVKAARRGAGPQRPSQRKRTASTGGPGSAEIRNWAKNQGIEVKDRGRVPAELVVKFKAAAAR
jgi:Lsr2